MKEVNVTFSSYSIGENVLKGLARECKAYGNKALVVAGHTALAKVKAKLEESTQGTELEIVDYLWYGGECSFENMDKVSKVAIESGAQIIIGVGGGKALDTAKGAGNKLKMPVMTVPTIAATCAGTTSVSAVYKEDDIFECVDHHDKPPIHCFIDSSIIAEAPVLYLRAGIGDTIAKHYECIFNSRGQELDHSSAMAVEMSSMCVKPLVKYGALAIEDCKKAVDSDDLRQVILSNIVSTGMVSKLIEFKYNSSVAHSLFYAINSIPEINKEYLHGDVVGYGVLVLLELDNRHEEAKELAKFYKSVEIPTTLKELNLRCGRDYLDKALEETINGVNMEFTPFTVTKDMIFNAIKNIESL